MSIQTELSRIINAKAAIKAAIDGKGVAVPDATLLDGMAALIESIEAGGGGSSNTIFGVEYKAGSITPAEDLTSFTIPYEDYVIGKNGFLCIVVCRDRTIQKGVKAVVSGTYHGGYSDSATKGIGLNEYENLSSEIGLNGKMIDGTLKFTATSKSGYLMAGLTYEWIIFDWSELAV